MGADGWLARWLYGLTLALASVLLLAVLLAPFADSGGPEPDGWGRLVVLFARDLTVRRTAAACAVGSMVTAWVFFRAQGPAAEASKRRPPRRPPPPVAGA